MFNWYLVICWHFRRNIDAFMMSTKKWNCWWRWLWRIRKEHTFCYSVEAFYVWNGYFWMIFLTIEKLIMWRYWNEYMFAWKSGQQIGTFGNKMETWIVYLNVELSILNDKEVKRFGIVCLKCYGHLMFENQSVIFQALLLIWFWLNYQWSVIPQHLNEKKIWDN